jgi:hypothetical protein
VSRPRVPGLSLQDATGRLDVDSEVLRVPQGEGTLQRKADRVRGLKAELGGSLEKCGEARRRWKNDSLPSGPDFGSRSRDEI